MSWNAGSFQTVDFQGGIREWNIESDADGDIRVHGKCPPDSPTVVMFQMSR